jgi:hypothetical protein
MRFKHSTKRFLFVVSLVFIAVFFTSVIYSSSEIFDPFSYSTGGTAQEFLNEERITTSPFDYKAGSWQAHADSMSFRVAPSIFLVFLSLTTGLQVNQLSIIPVMGLAFFTLSYALAKKLSNSSLIALAYILIICFDVGISSFNSNVFYISYGFSLLMMFLFVYSKMLLSNGKIRVWEGILFLTYVILFLSYYSCEFNALLFLVVMTVGIIVFRNGRPNFGKLAMIFLVIFALDPVVEIYFSRANLGSFVSSFLDYLNYLTRFLTSGEKAVVEYRPYVSEPVLTYLDFLYRTLLIFLILIYSIYVLINILKRRVSVKRFGFSLRTLAFSSLIFIFIVNIIVYGTMGQTIGFRLFFLFFPLIALVCLNKLRISMEKSHRWKTPLALTLIFLVIIPVGLAKFVLAVKNPFDSGDFRYHTSIGETTVWAGRYFDAGDVIANFRISGRIFLEIVNAEKANSTFVFYNQFNQIVVSLSTANCTLAKDFFRGRNLSYLILSRDLATEPIYLEAWSGRAVPLGSALFNVDNFTVFDKVYDDNRGYTYVFTGG